MQYKSFKDLSIWQLSLDLIEEVYCLTKSFPPEEKYNLISQIKRSSVSVAGNIAESWGRYHYADKVRVLYIARGEIKETRNYLLIAKRLIFFSSEDYNKLENLYTCLLEDLNKYKKSLINKINE